MEQSTWKKLIELINSFNLTSKLRPIITRKYIKRHLAPTYPMVTIDNYRKILSRLGYLKSVHNGLYRIMKRIPDDLTTNKAWKQCGYHRKKKQ
jgi:hypothetical protein